MANAGVDVVEDPPHIDEPKLSGKLSTSNPPFPGGSYNVAPEGQADLVQKLIFPILINPNDKTTEIIDLFGCTDDQHRGKTFHFPTSTSQARVKKGGRTVSGMKSTLLPETLVVLNFAS